MNNLVYAGYANPADGKAPHTHKGFEIICFSQYGEVECGGRIYSFSEGDAAVIPPLTAHNTRYAEGSLRAILEQALLPVRTIKAIKAKCRGKEYSPVVKALMESIELNFGDQTYSLENAIRALPLNYDYIRKLFLKETGATPREYLEQKRMERARDIILSGATNRYSEFTVSQIAEACGKKIVNGVSMLFYQAYYAECIYFDRRPQDEEAKELFNEYSKGVRA